MSAGPMKPTGKLSAVVLAAALVLGPASLVTSAAAQTSTTASRQADLMAVLKARGKAEIDRRLTFLGQLKSRVASAQNLTASDRGTLTSQIDGEVSGLTALEARIAADTDLATLRADVRSIVTAYRVYLLMGPKVHLVVGADGVVALAGRFDAIVTKLQAAIARAAAAGMDVTRLNALLADVQAKVADAKTKAGGVPGSVLPLLPSGYPGNRPTLEAARQDLRSARQDLRTARSDAREIVDALKAFRGSSTTTTTTTPP